jgi:NTP pyrophosphatase (non-canonical NTP hydrolase)
VSDAKEVADLINDMVDRGILGIMPQDAQTIQSLCADVHGRNVAAGWWSDLKTGERLQRNMGELLCLVHSEVSEAHEGYDHQSKDDKLPHRVMMEVELVDVLIRVFDIAGGFDLRLGQAYIAVNVIVPGWDALVLEHIGHLHRAISRAMEGHRKNKPCEYFPPFTQLETALAELVIRVFDLAREMCFDLGGAYVEKLAFNATRADHKPENRRAAGGKAY